MGAQKPGRPRVVVLAGVNGAGKSTAATHLLRDGLRVPSFTNADTLARGLNAFDVAAVAAEAGRVMLAHLHKLAAARQSFAFETTLSGRAYARWLAGLTKDGYAVHLFYYWLRSPDLAVRRVADRVRAGGHHVPEDTIRRRYTRSVRNFLDLYRPIVTTWQLYDNSDGDRLPIAFNNSFFDTVRDPDAWGAFQGSAGDGAGNDPAGD